MWMWVATLGVQELTITISKRGSLLKGTSFMYNLRVFPNTDVVSFIGKQNVSMREIRANMCGKHGRMW